MAELKIWERYYVSRQRGGILGDFTVVPDKKSDFGIIVVKTEEEREKLHNYPAFKQRAIWPVDKKDEPELINTNKDLKSPAEKETPNIFKDMFDEVMHTKISNLSKDSISIIKDNILQIVEKEFPKSEVTKETEKLNAEARKKFEDALDKPIDPKKAGVGKLPPEEPEEKRSFQFLIPLYKKTKEFNAWIKTNQLEDTWKEYKKKKDIKGFVKLLEEENND